MCRGEISQGVAWLSGMYLGFYPKKVEFAQNWSNDVRFEPRLDSVKRQKLLQGWELAINRTVAK